jgi:hypothetical protein
MPARGGGKNRGFLAQVTRRHDREFAHALIFFLVGLIFIGSYALVGVAAAGQSIDFVMAKLDAGEEPIAVAEPTEIVETVPALVPRRLDGLLVPREESNRVPICVMIENAAFGGVRPQSGLSQAGVVYEVIVEGGITRLMAVFDGELAGTIGPVRSARDTYLEFASELNCPYVHAGGSYTALLALRNFQLRDIDGLVESGYFWREPGKYAPHDLFSSGEQVRQAVADHGWATEAPPDYAMWNFVNPEEQVDSAVVAGVEEPAETRADRVSIGFGGPYDVEYRYRAQDQAYERWNGGVLHTDANTGEAILVKNVIIQQVGEGNEIEGKGRVNWPVTGEGPVQVLHAGERLDGTWKKPQRVDRTQFFATDGSLLPLIPGNSWVEIVPPHVPVTIE